MQTKLKGCVILYKKHAYKMQAFPLTFFATHLLVLLEGAVEYIFLLFCVSLKLNEVN